MTDYVPWLRGLAERGGNGVVNNIDARSLGRIADELERLKAELLRTYAEVSSVVGRRNEPRSR